MKKKRKDKHATKSRCAQHEFDDETLVNCSHLILDSVFTMIMLCKTEYATTKLGEEKNETVPIYFLY